MQPRLGHKLVNEQAYVRVTLQSRVCATNIIMLLSHTLNYASEHLRIQAHTQLISPIRTTNKSPKSLSIDMICAHTRHGIRQLETLHECVYQIQIRKYHSGFR